MMFGLAVHSGWLSSRAYRQLAHPLIVALIIALTFSAFVNASFAAGSDRFLCLSTSSEAQQNDKTNHANIIEHCALCFVSMPGANNDNSLNASQNYLGAYSKLKPSTSQNLRIRLSQLSILIRGPPVS